MYVKLYNEEMEKYKDYIQIFTDWSKLNNQTGSAVVINDQVRQYHLTDHCSIFTAKSFSILEAAKLIKEEKNFKKCIILTDSLSVTQTLQNMYSRDYIIQRVQDIISKGRKIVNYVDSFPCGNFG